MYTLIMLSLLISGYFAWELSPILGIIVWAIALAAGNKADSFDVDIFCSVIFSLALAGIVLDVTIPGSFLQHDISLQILL
jgi:hypothetical protein